MSVRDNISGTVVSRAVDGKVKRSRSSGPKGSRSGRVQLSQIDEGVRQAAMKLVDGDISRLTVESETSVRID